MLQNDYPVPAKYDARKRGLRPQQDSTSITQIKRCTRKDDFTNRQDCSEPNPQPGAPAVGTRWLRQIRRQPRHRGLSRRTLKAFIGNDKVGPHPNWRKWRYCELTLTASWLPEISSIFFRNFRACPGYPGHSRILGAPSFWIG